MTPGPSDARRGAEAHRGSGSGDEERRIPLVGIGASAGGLEALRAFFDALPDDLGAAYAVLVHRAPEHRTRLAEILQEHTRMPVRDAEEDVRVVADRVYVTPSDRNLATTRTGLKLLPRAGPGKNLTPIDGFFRSLGATHGPDSVGVLLSGMGSDGAQGIRRIREGGGITLVQDPADAEHEEMPGAAIRVGAADRVLPAGELGREVARFIRCTARIDPDRFERRFERDGQSVLDSVLGEVRQRSGREFGDHSRAMVVERLRRRMRLRGVEDPAGYLEVLRDDPDEAFRLDRDLLDTVTSFLREPADFAALARSLDTLLDRKEPGDDFRVWVAGCGTGEEAYSVAMILQEKLERRSDTVRLRIFGTDRNEEAFALARDGLYPEGIAAEVGEERVERHFEKESSGYRVRQHLRERVLFSSHDVLRDPPFAHLDLVACRTLLPCYRSEARRQALHAFHYGLAGRGHLFLGSRDAVEDAPGLFRAVEARHRIYRAIPRDEARTLAVPGMDLPLEFGRKRPATVPDHGRVPREPLGVVHHQLVEMYAPPSLVVNADLEVVHLSDKAGRYLRMGEGTPKAKLLDLVSGELRAELEAALARAFESGTTVRGKVVTFDAGNGGTPLRPIVLPVRSPDDGREVRRALVLFEEIAEPLDEEKAEPWRASEEEARLAKELRRVRERLRAVVDERDRTIQEYRAANEELRSAHEEQAITAEELEARQEELQVVAEELGSLNEERARTIRELAQVNADLENFIDSAELTTIFLDGTLNIRRFTPPAAEVFRIKDGDIGRSIEDLAHDLDHPGLIPDARRVVESMQRIEREVRAQDDRWYLLRLLPYCPTQGTVGVVLTLIETTERKEAELERERLLEETRRANRAKADFLRALSHEFRTPLSALVGYADLLSEGLAGELTEVQRSHVDRVRTVTEQLTGMVEEILTYVRLESGKASIAIDEVDPGEIALGTIHLVEPQARARGLELRVEVADELPTLVTDRVKLRQILTNLLGNAVKYTEKGHVALHVEAEPNGVRFEVSDSGIGITPENLERVFDRFWQVEGGSTRAYGGTGLGLTVSRDLARLLGGDVTVRSEPGRGSRFTVRLPLVAPDRPE